MTTPPPRGERDTRWGDPVGGLRLGVQGADARELLLRLANVGRAPLEVLSHVLAAEVHLDWYTLRLQGADGAVRTLRLMDARNKAGVVRVSLAPGEDLAHRVNVAAWARRPVNGAVPLAPGVYRLSASYEVDRADPGDHWRGRLEAGPVELFSAP